MQTNLNVEQEIAEGYRLSPQQKRVWLLQQTERTNNDWYQVQCRVTIKGNLQPKILHLVLQQITNRHEILRTTFHCLPEMTVPLQKITENSVLEENESDLSSLSAIEQKKQIEILASKFSNISFDLEKSPLLLYSLIKLSSSQHILLVKLPALCADAVTLNNLVSEISQVYFSYLQNQALTDVEIQYADIAQWFQELVENEDEDSQIGKKYWHNQNFTNFDRPLTIEQRRVKDTIENRPIISPTEFKPQKIESLVIQSNLREKIDILVQKYLVTAPDIIFSCWQILLWKLTNKTDITIGNVYNGRKYEELTHSMGLFAKYLPFCSHLTEELKFSQLLQQVRKKSSELYKWQDYFTWDDIKLAHSTSLSTNFFSYCFDFEEKPTQHENENLSFSIEQKQTCIDRFKIKIACSYAPQSLSIDFHYDSNLFAEKDIQRLAQQFNQLLQSAITEPEKLIDELDILRDEDRQQLLTDFNNTTVDYSQDKLIQQLFEEQVKIRPDCIAVVFDEEELTYAQLNAKSNQLAHYLITQKVEPESIVALYLDRSLEQIIGILGILKAGGAYLPLDPNLPPEGLAYRLESADVGVILTQKKLVEKIADFPAKVICLDNEENLTIASQENPQINGTKPENLIYLIYTSGSTGKPKAVAVEHRQIINYLYGITEELSLADGCSLATVSTFAADLGNTAIFPSLCMGGCLHLISPEKATDADAFADYCNRYPIDCLKIVPSHLAALLSSSRSPEILPRQRLILGGEACTWSLIELVQKYAMNECQIFNHYGPTETTVGVLTYKIDPERSIYTTKTVPLGTPIPNTQIYILDKKLKPVPIGVTGELYIGGANVSRGYFNQPSLNTEKFITNPFVDSSSFNNRLYKTGDNARYLPTGDIEFLGRTDNQVKIRGFRIELGEIESVLNQHPAIETNVVTVWEESDNKRLVAYLVSNSESKVEIAELREFLQRYLPEYTIPSLFLFLESLPLTANGKIDRHALPSPQKALPKLNYIAPTNAVEEILADLWADILGVSQVGIEDNFFDLGGHSLLATQLISRVRHTFRAELTLRSLFEEPTIINLSQTLIANEAKRGQTEKIAQTFKKINNMSPEQKQKMLEQKRKGGKA